MPRPRTSTARTALVRSGVGAVTILLAAATLVGIAGPASAAPSRPTGCASRSRVPRGEVTSSITVAGVTHPYRLAVPARYDPARPTPLVLLFHGFGGDGASIADLTHLPTAGAARGFLVATPDGPNHTWQLSGTGSDAAFVDALVGQLSHTYCVDARRVFAAGFSQGAAFSIFYACARPGRVAAIATVAVDFQLGCTRPQSILAFHGTADPLVPYQDGAIGLSLPGVKVRGTLLNLGDWAHLDGCRPAPQTTTIASDVQRSTWPRCRAGTSVTLYTVLGGGHAWPGADPAKNPTFTTQHVNATTVALDFFHRHHLP